jgi:Arc/MetJ family transcription regulator
MGRTNVVLDDELVKEGMRLSSAKTIRDLIDRSLRHYLNYQKRQAMRSLKGSGIWSGDLDELRGAAAKNHDSESAS